MDDIERLRLIAALTSDGLNIAGVKAVLALEQQPAELRATIGQLEAKLDERRRSPRPG